MTPGYHLLQFIPDPFSGTTITFGALVESGDGWRFAEASAGELVLPSGIARAATHLFRALLAELQGLRAPRLPMSIGPHVRLQPRAEVPEGAIDPVQWVTAFVLPAASRARPERRTPRTRRSTIGKLFFREYKVGRFVKSHFKPEMAGGHARTVRPISHYVTGERETLLLEPVYLEADNFQNEVQDVCSTLLAWQSVVRRQQHAANFSFSVYALGASMENLRYLGDALSDTKIELVDTANDAQRRGLLAHIRSAAESTTILNS